MNNPHLYSIGNALVDIDFKITPELLEEHGIEKGVMTLIDSDRAQHLLAQLAKNTEAKACGGSASNTTILLSQLGGRAFYSGRVGNDELGSTFYQTLKRQGVATNIPENNRQEGATGTCLVMVTPDTDRTMNTHLGVASSFSKKDLDETALTSADYFYIEGYLVTTDSGFEAILKGCELAKKNNTKIVLTLSDRNLVKAFKDRFTRILNHGVELLFCNELEVMSFIEHDDLWEASKMLRKHCNSFAITLGPNGSLVYDGEKFIESPAYDVETLDSVGAGDTFAGSFIYSLTQGFDFERASEIANFASGLVVAKYGPRLNDDEIARVRALIEKHQANA